MLYSCLDKHFKMRVSFFFLCVFFWGTSFSQDFEEFQPLTITSEIPVNISKDRFPTIDFNFHSRDPKKIQDSDLKLSEFLGGDQKEISDVSFEVIQDTVDYSDANKCVLILLESLDHSDKREQNKTFEKALNELFDENIIRPGDQFKICTFSHKKNGTVLVSLNKNFTDNVDKIKSAFKPKSSYNNRSSDILSAIEEGLEMLSEFDTDLPKFIFLLSDDNVSKKEAKKLWDDIIKNANKRGVVINNIKYNRADNSSHDVSVLSKGTFGESKILTYSSGRLNVHNEKKKEIKSFIKKTLSNAVKRSKGINYKVSADLSNNFKDGEKYRLQLDIAELGSVSFKYKAPGNWIIKQFQVNTLLASIVSALIFIFLLLIIILIISSAKKRKRIRQQLNQNLIQEQQSLKVEQDRINQEQEAFKKKEAIKQEAIKNRREAEKNKKREERLIKEMKNIGPFPILKYTYEGKTREFLINKPIVKVGRKEDQNDLFIPSPNFSRTHFSIRFSEEKYKIIDNKSTNGVLLNGKKIKEAFIKPGDVIQIAKVKFYFL